MLWSAVWINSASAAIKVLSSRELHRLQLKDYRISPADKQSPFNIIGNFLVLSLQ